MSRLSYRWVILSVVWTAFFASFFVRANWGPLLPFVKSEMKLTMTECGLFMSAFYLGYLIMQLPSGLLADAYGTRKIMGFMQIWAGACTLLTGLMESFIEGVILRFFTGLGAGCLYAPTGRAIRQWFSRRERATAMSIFVTAHSVQGIVGGSVLPLLAYLYGWRWGFFFPGLIVVCSGLYALIFLREKSVALHSTTKIRLEFASRDVWLMALGGSFVTYVWNAIATFLVAYLILARHFANVTAGLVFAEYSVTFVIATVFSGWFSDRIGKRKPLIVTPLLGTSLLICVLGVIDNPAYLLGIVAMLGFAFGLRGSPMSTLVIEAVDAKHSGTAAGFTNTFWQIGSVISPLVFGYVLDTTDSWMLGWLNVALCALIAASILFGIKEKEIKQNKLSSKVFKCRNENSTCNK